MINNEEDTKTILALASVLTILIAIGMVIVPYLREIPIFDDFPSFTLNILYFFVLFSILIAMAVIGYRNIEPKQGESQN